MAMQLMRRTSGIASRAQTSDPAQRKALQLQPSRFAQPLRPARQQRRARHASTVVAAVDTEKPSPQGDKPDVAKLADSIGLPTDEGLFGFKPFSEVWVGRLAMMGFLVSLLEEFWTGKGTLQQIGLSTPSTPLFFLVAGLSGVATLVATSQTLVKAQTGQLEPQQVNRYKSFLGIQPDAEVDAEADALKRRGDFTSPTDLNAIEEAKAAGTPADRFLNDLPGQEREANQAAEELKQQEQRARDADKTGPSLSINARSDIVEQTTAQAAEWAYARQVEVQNGRFAMLGFLGSTIVETITGKGIIGQVILYLKALNVLGPNSGF